MDTPHGPGRPSGGNLRGLAGDSVTNAELRSELLATRAQLLAVLAAVEHNITVLDERAEWAEPEPRDQPVAAPGWYDCGDQGRLYWSGQFWQQPSGELVAAEISTAAPGGHHVQTVLLTVGGLLVSGAGLAFAFFAYQWLPLPAQLGMLAFGALAAGLAAIGLRYRLPIASGAFAAISFVLSLVVVGAAPAKRVVPADWSPVTHPDHLWFPVASLALVVVAGWLGSRLRIPAWQWLAAAAGPVFWVWSWLALGLAIFGGSDWLALILIPIAASAVTISAAIDTRRSRDRGPVSAPWWIALGAAATVLLGYLGLGLAATWIAKFAAEDTSGIALATLLSLVAVTAIVALAGWSVGRAGPASGLPRRWQLLVASCGYFTWVAAIQFGWWLLDPDQSSADLTAWLVVLLASIPTLWVLIGSRSNARLVGPAFVLALPLLFVTLAPLFAQLAPWAAVTCGRGALLYVSGALALVAGLLALPWLGLLWAVPPLWWLAAAVTTGRPLSFVAVSVAAGATVGIGWLRSIWLPRQRSDTPTGPSSLAWAAIPIVCWSIVVLADPSGWPGPQPTTVQQVAVFALLALIFAAVTAAGVQLRLAGLIVGGVWATGYFAVMALIPLVSGFPTWVYLLAAGLVLLAAGMQLERLRRGQAAARSFLAECR